METIKKEKNAFSVALKGSKKEMKELEKVFNKEREVFENKIVYLSEFKNQKLIEEREERVKKKREAKKAKQKEQFEKREDLTKDSMNNLTCMANNKNDLKEATNVKGDTQEAETSKKSDDTTENITEENGAQDPENTTYEAVDEDDPEFIGPKLPPRMTKEEIAAFYKEIMEKFKLDEK